MLKGCFTALVTPFTNDHKLDQRALEKLIEFQVTNGISGVLAVGTTGESPTLEWQEHNDVTRLVCEGTKGKCKSIAGTGSNSTRETLEGSEHAAKFGADAVLVVDPYYNGPSSLEIRREYVEPVAKSVSGDRCDPLRHPGPNRNPDASRGPGDPVQAVSECPHRKGGDRGSEEHGPHARGLRG